MTNLKISTLVDDFNSGTWNPALWQVVPADGGDMVNGGFVGNGGSVAVVGGQLCITTAISAGSNWRSLETIGLYDLTNSQITIQMVSYGDDVAVPQLDAYPMIIFDPSGAYDFIWTEIYDGTLVIWDGQGIGASLAYDPAVHKWFRVWESSGTYGFDHSIDGLTWTNIYTSGSDPFDLSAVKFAICSGNGQGVATAATTSIFDNVNVLPPQKLHYTERNGVLVQDGLNPLQGIQDPGPGTCINCGQYIPKLNHHYSQYFGYICLPPWQPNGTDPRPITVPTS